MRTPPDIRNALPRYRPLVDGRAQGDLVDRVGGTRQTPPASGLALLGCGDPPHDKAEAAIPQPEEAP